MSKWEDDRDYCGPDTFAKEVHDGILVPDRVRHRFHVVSCKVVWKSGHSVFCGSNGNGTF